MQTDPSPCALCQSRERGLIEGELMCCGAWRGWIHRSQAGGGQFMVWCAVFLSGSKHSFPDRLEQRADETSPGWGLPRLETQCLSTDGFWWWEWCCRILGPRKTIKIVLFFPHKWAGCLAASRPVIWVRTTIYIRSFCWVLNFHKKSCSITDQKHLQHCFFKLQILWAIWVQHEQAVNSEITL